MKKLNQKIHIEFDVDETKYDKSNPLIFSKDQTIEKSKKIKKIEHKQIKSQLLSKKKKKKLEKVLERKNRKLNRAKLINDLQQYQVDEKEYDLMPSTSVVQTTGKRRINDLLKLYNSVNNSRDANNNSEQNNTEYVHKRFKIRRIKFKSNEKNFNRKDPNIVGLSDDDESNSTSSEKSESDEEKTMNNQKVPYDQELKKQGKSNDLLESKSALSENEIQVKNTIDNPIPRCSKNKEKSCKTVYVTVDRSEEIQKARLKLPILAEEHSIMEAIMYNSVVIICGETGSGKTTQVPQFLYEAGYTTNDKMIGITEPRRVAAISMSKRVAYELNMTEEEVSYQIRFEGNVTEKTRIKFMTDGILMKEIEQDFILSKYSALIIDEAHERSLYSDILIGFLSRIVQLRNKTGNPLKLIIMSATLRVEDFTENTRLFKNPPPVIKIDSRQYPVTVHFSKFTNPNYLQEAFKKICKIHTVSPPGGILVFVTGRREVLSLCRMLKAKFPYVKGDKADDEIKENKLNEVILSNKNDEIIKGKPILKPKVNLDIYSINPIESERITDDFDNSDNESENNDSDFVDDESESDLGFLATKEPLYCLPLFSMMPTNKQSLVFRNPPPGFRLCVIATNVAETSLTIPNIKYVIDTGKIKNKVYDNVTSISTFVIEWTSKASADQRAGRAGRTSVGHCYRLYSSAIFNDQFKQYSDPEILVKPVDDLLLQMKAIGIENVINFPFPTKPNVESLIAAEKRLILLDALEEQTLFGRKNKKISCSKITRIGKLMSYFPVNPRYSKMLCLSNQCNLMPYTLTIISALTVQELFLIDINKATQERRKNFFFTNPLCQTLGDLMALLSAFGAVQYEGLSPKFCEHYGIRYNAIVEINKLRLQLLNQVRQISKSSNLSSELSVPEENQVKMLSQLFLCAFGDHIAKRIPFICITEEDENGNIKKIQKSIRNCYQSIEVEDYVFISPHSVLFNETCEYVAYHEIFESSKMYMRNIVPIQAEWIPVYVAKHCTFSNPLDDPPPKYDPKDDKIKCFRKSTFGRYNWELPIVEVEYPDGIEKYCYFAYFLFEGKILKWFQKNVKFMSAPSIIFTKSWALVQPKVENVIKCFTTNGINTKRALQDKWKSDKKFLLKEYLEWIHESQRDHIRRFWPPN